MDFRSMTSDTRSARLLAYAVGLHLLLSAGAPLHARAQGAPDSSSTRPAQQQERGARGKASPNGPAKPAGAAGPSATAAGQTTSPGDANDPNSAVYRDLVDHALSEFKLENWPEARLLFRRAHELNPNARTLRGIGVVSYEMREYVPAIVALSAALADPRQPLTPAQRRECEELLARAQSFVASFSLRLVPETAALKVDGAQPVHDGEGRLLLSFGEHMIEASAPGYESETKKLVVEGNEHGVLELVLEPPAPPVAPTLATEPRALPPVARTSAPASSLAGGEREGGLRYTWVALGASAAFGGAAAATWFTAERKFESLKDDCQEAAAQGSPCVRGQTDTDAVKRFERMTNALLGMSAASLLTAAILMPIEWPREKRLALDLGPHRIGLRGSF